MRLRIPDPCNQILMNREQQSNCKKTSQKREESHCSNISRQRVSLVSDFHQEFRTPIQALVYWRPQSQVPGNRHKFLPLINQSHTMRTIRFNNASPCAPNFLEPPQIAVTRGNLLRPRTLQQRTHPSIPAELLKKP